MNLYQISQHKGYLADLVAIYGTLKRGDEMVRGLESILLTNPQAGHHIGANIWCLESEQDCGDRVCVTYIIETGPAPADKKVLCVSMFRI